MASEELSFLIKKYAKKYDLEPELIAAIIMQESSGNPWASRKEPLFYARYVARHGRSTLPGFVPPSHIVDLITEKNHRATSWGCMQCMGETAREAGFSENELVRLLDPDVGIEWGCRILLKCIKRANGDIDQALLYWNGGGNAQYPKEVFAHIANGNINKIL